MKMKYWQRNLSKHLSNNIKAHVTFTSQKLSIQCNVKTKMKTNMMLFILVNIQGSTVLIIILVNLLGESLSKLQIIVV